jgi:4-nitrophenyl phosphatase
MFNLSEIKAIVFDLDGVIWRGSIPVPGAVETVARFREAGIRCFYCTNNSRKAAAEFTELLNSMGIEAQEEEVMTSADATALYLSQQFTGDFSAYVVGEDGLMSSLRRVGARIVNGKEAESSSSNYEDFPIDCVVAGIDRGFNYDKLRLAQRFIMSGARFIATNRDSTFPVSDGVVPGAGSIVSAIETACGSSPLVIGKPQPLMMQLLLQKFHLSPRNTAFVGDRLDTDIVAARRAGVAGIFVSTGINTMEQAQRARGDFKPDFIYFDLPALAEAMPQLEGVKAPAVVAGMPPADTLPSDSNAQESEAAQPVVAVETAVLDAPADEFADLDELAPLKESPDAVVVGEGDGEEKASAGDDVSAIDDAFAWKEDVAVKEVETAQPLLDNIPPLEFADDKPAEAAKADVIKADESAKIDETQNGSPGHGSMANGSVGDKTESAEGDAPADKWWESLDSLFEEKPKPSEEN